MVSCKSTHVLPNDNRANSRRKPGIELNVHSWHRVSDLMLPYGPTSDIKVRTCAIHGCEILAKVPNISDAAASPARRNAEHMSSALPGLSRSSKLFPTDCLLMFAMIDMNRR